MMEITSSPTEVSKSSTEIPEWYNQSRYTTVIHSVTGIAVCLLNLMCFIAIIKRRLHRDEKRFLFMASLSMADSLFGFSLLFSASVTLMTDNTTVCAIGSILLETTIAGDVLCLCLITADQFMRIELHMKYPVYATFRNACLAISVVIVLCLAHLLSAIIVWYHWSDGQCVYVLLPIWYHAYNLVFYLLIPILIIVGMHLRIFYISWTQTKKLSNLAPVVGPCQANATNGKTAGKRRCEVQHLEGHQDDDHCDSIQKTSGRSIAKAHHGHKSVAPKVCPCGHNDRSEARRQWKTVITITVLVGVLLCTWLPANIVLSLLTFRPDYNPGAISSQTLTEMTSLLYFANPLLNPLIYIARIPEVKREIKRMMSFFE